MASSPVEFDRFARQMYEAQSRPDGSLRRRKEVLAAMREICEVELTQQQRTAVELCFFQGLTVTAAAQVMGLHKSTVSRHIAAGKKRIEKSLRYVAFPLWREGD